MSAQGQTVVITRMADRHAEPHRRDFAQSVQTVVSAAGLADVLRETAEQIEGAEVGRWSITISEPFDLEGDR